ncbi:MAG TPA: hypothetical protein VFC51_18095, partial [Chloroflexota bacterium]|nr:hypothetical protein [Chloroflexota bacterium]
MHEARWSGEPQRSIRPRITALTRPNAIAQIALQLWQMPVPGAGPYGNVRMSLTSWAEGASAGDAVTLGIEGMETIAAVGRGELDLGTLNPSAFLTMAYRGTGPFSTPLPLRAIAVMPSFDLMGFALAGSTGCTSLAEVRERRVPLRISIRDDASHSPPLTVDQVLQAEGFSLADVEAWGGSVQLLGAPPGDPKRIEGMRSGAITAVFDEGINTWGGVALESGFCFARLQDSTLAAMEEIGWPILPLSPLFPTLGVETFTLSFSGWPIYTHAGLPEEVGYLITDALWRARDAINWDLDRPVELADLRGGT